MDSDTLQNWESAFPVGMRFFWKKCLDVDLKVGDLGDVKDIMTTHALEVIVKRDTAGNEREQVTDGIWVDSLQTVLERTPSKEDNQPCQCHPKTYCPRRMDAEKIVWHWLTRRKDVRNMWARRSVRKAKVTMSYMEEMIGSVRNDKVGTEHIHILEKMEMSKRIDVVSLQRGVWKRMRTRWGSGEEWRVV